MSKKLIVFGGSFDPIHKGHIQIAIKAFKKIKADKLFFVPCSQNHPNNKTISATNEQRMDMINLCIKNHPYFEICDYEIKNNDAKSYTINTIQYLKSNYSEYELYLLIGYDQLINFKNWKDYKEILDYAKIICYVRKIENNNLLKEVDFPYTKIGLFNINTASSELKIKPSRKYLDDKVIEYINDNAIYGPERLSKVMSQYRYDHCLTVANIAKELALTHKLYPLVNRAYVAGLYHDYAKEFAKEKQIEIAKKLKIKNYPSWKVLHGPVGAYVIEKEFLMNDYQVLTAIKNHVIPKNFSTLTKLVYVADKIAPRHDTNNGDKEYQKWIKLSKTNLDECFRTIIDYYKKQNKKE